MTMHNNEPESFDRWTGMPNDLDADVEPLALPIPQPTTARESRFDVRSLFWKFVASGSAATPPAVLSVLSSDERAQIRRRCGANPATPADALAMLSSDSVEGVRVAVAQNVHTPLFVLRKLAHDPSTEVRFAIASNREMPDAILLSLFMDPDPLVAERASQTLAA
jgi:hypothetical protein